GEAERVIAPNHGAERTLDYLGPSLGLGLGLVSPLGAFRPLHSEVRGSAQKVSGAVLMWDRPSIRSNAEIDRAGAGAAPAGEGGTPPQGAGRHPGFRVSPDVWVFRIQGSPWTASWYLKGARLSYLLLHAVSLKPPASGTCAEKRMAPLPCSSLHAPQSLEECPCVGTGSLNLIGTQLA